jgi:hypothetical protein
MSGRVSRPLSFMACVLHKLPGARDLCLDDVSPGVPRRRKEESPHMSDSTNLVYIMGHGYSGSTLLTFLLGSHPEIATVGEVGIAPKAKGKPEEFLCSCKAPIRECDFWQQVTRGMKDRGYDFDVWETAHEFRADGGGLTDAVLRAVQRGPLFESARRLALGVLPSASSTASCSTTRPWWRWSPTSRAAGPSSTAPNVPSAPSTCSASPASTSR